MFGGMNPKQMQKLLQQMGIKSEEVKAKKVTIEKEDGEIIITEPHVMLVEMGGQKSFQVTGKIEERGSDEDAKLVAQQAGVGLEEARRALEEEGGNIAAAILRLKKG
ncbi:MAG: nascent polypeptide-associated complex protein [Candidatus Micrarchaeia archaeon]